MGQTIARGRCSFDAWEEELKLAKEFSLKHQCFEKSCSNYNLHVFSDASLESICKVAYLRIQIDNENQFSFVIGRNETAPMNKQSISRLEVQAALFAVRLRQRISSDHDITIKSLLHWTDSVTVLHCLHAANQKQKGFVKQIVLPKYWKRQQIMSGD